MIQTDYNKGNRGTEMTKQKVDPDAPITFGKLVTQEQIASNYGFVYLVVVTYNPDAVYKLTSNVKYYVGSKSFKDANWRTYITSSKICQKLILVSQMHPDLVKCEFHILELVDERHFTGKPGNLLLSRETKYIYDYFNRFGKEKIINVGVAGGKSLRTGKSLRKKRLTRKII